VAFWKKEATDLDYLNDANRLLDRSLQELLPGGRASKMVLADANESALAETRILWEFVGVDVWEEQDVQLQARVKAAIDAELHTAREHQAREWRLFRHFASPVCILWEIGVSGRRMATELTVSSPSRRRCGYVGYSTPSRGRRWAQCTLWLMLLSTIATSPGAAARRHWRRRWASSQGCS
jgi:hypothetical protein